MNSLARNFLAVVANPNEYPMCVVDSATYFTKLKTQSNANCLEIKKNYRDIWNDFITRPLGRKDGFAFSTKMRIKYGRERMSEFYSLRSKINDYHRILKYDKHSFLAEIKLVKIDNKELTDVLKFIENFNQGLYNKDSGSWIMTIPAKRFSEIIVWKMIQKI